MFPDRQLESNQGEVDMELIIPFGVLIAVWIVVLWGSRFFGPKD